MREDSVTFIHKTYVEEKKPYDGNRVIKGSTIIVA